MEIKKVISDKKEFLELLLLADEQESMIDRYLERGDMFVLYDNGLKACCVVTREGEGIYEIKNIATISFFQRVLSGFSVPFHPSGKHPKVAVHICFPVHRTTGCYHTIAS